MFCGSGEGAARTFYKTTSPSGRLAFGWRLTDRPPTVVPEENDLNLENIVVRVGDGAILAKSHGSYWDLGTKIAKAHVSAAWSPDSHLAVKVEQRSESASAELFAFDQSDRATGPFELVGVIKPVVLSQMKYNQDAGDYGLVFASHPATTINNDGLIDLRVQAIKEDGPDSPVYEVKLKISSVGNSLSATVDSITPYPKASIFVTVH